LLPALLCVLSCRPFLPLFYLYLCEQRLYSQTQCLWSMIHDFSNVDIFNVIFIPSEVVFRARNWSQLNDCDQIIQRPYSEWGNYHNQMVKINWSGFSYWNFPYSQTICSMRTQPIRRKIQIPVENVHTGPCMVQQQ
jgi:hypothetical protein